MQVWQNRDGTVIEFVDKKKGTVEVIRVHSRQTHGMEEYGSRKSYNEATGPQYYRNNNFTRVV